jgi:hypothetical protein
MGQEIFHPKAFKMPQVLGCASLLALSAKPVTKPRKPQGKEMEARRLS